MVEKFWSSEKTQSRYSSFVSRDSVCIKQLLDIGVKVGCWHGYNARCVGKAEDAILVHGETPRDEEFQSMKRIYLSCCVLRYREPDEPYAGSHFNSFQNFNTRYLESTEVEDAMSRIKRSGRCGLVASGRDVPEVNDAVGVGAQRKVKADHAAECAPIKTLVL